jgi:predicted dehydrogenase
MFNQRTNPVYRKMKEIVSSGELGEIRRVSVIITDWFRAQSYYDSGAWRATWKQDGGGVLLNQAPHNLDLWQWICGMPKSVHAFCGFGRWHDVEIEDDVTAYVEYANGATGTFVTCTGEVPGTNRFEISMDGGQLVYEHGRLTLARPAVSASRFIHEYTGGYGKPDVKVEDITPDEPYPMHQGVISAFVRHILYGEPMVADGREGLQSLMLSNAMLLSSWTEETVTLPFGKEEDARFEELLARCANRSQRRMIRPMQMDLSKAFR